MKNSSQVIALNEILSRCHDAENGYREAAKIVNNERLERMFRDFAQERFQFSLDIIGLIKQSGGKADSGETLFAKIHQFWMNFRNLLATDNEGAMLNEIIRGEEYAIETYNKALASIDIQSPIYTELVLQRNQIRTTIDRINQLIPVYES